MSYATLHVRPLIDLARLTPEQAVRLITYADELGYGSSTDAVEGDWQTQVISVVAEALRVIFVDPEGPAWLIAQDFAVDGWEVDVEVVES